MFCSNGINVVPTGCIVVKATLRKAKFSGDFLGAFHFLRARLFSKNSSMGAFNFSKNHRFLQIALVNPLVRTMPVVRRLLS